jgi:hypothetical protein
VGGVAEQDDVAVVPALAADGDEADPQRPVRQQLVAAELGGEQLLAEGDAVLLARQVLSVVSTMKVLVSASNG